MASLGTSKIDGTAVFDGTSFSEIHLADAQWLVGSPRAMALGRAGVVWLGGVDGLVRMIDGRLDRFDWTPGSREKSRTSGVFSLLAEGDNPLLVGGRTGLYTWNRGNLKLATARVELPRQIIRARSGVLWIAAGAGV